MSRRQSPKPGINKADGNVGTDPSIVAMNLGRYHLGWCTRVLSEASKLKDPRVREPQDRWSWMWRVHLCVFSGWLGGAGSRQVRTGLDSGSSSVPASIPAHQSLRSHLK